MAYTLLDDQFYDHPKVIALGNDRDGCAAVGLQCRAMSYCAGHPTNGHVSFEIDEMFLGRSANRYRGMLLANGLRDVCRDHERCTVIHGWLDPKYRNLSADEIKSRRDADAARKRAARAAAKGECPPDVQPDADRTDPGRPDGHDADSPPDVHADLAGARAGGRTPTPTPTPPSSSVENSPSSSVMEGEDLSDPAGRIRSRRKAAGLSLDGWDADGLHGLVARNADVFGHGPTEQALWSMLDVLAPLPETNSPGRVLNEHGQALARRLLAERRNADAHRRQGENALADIEHRQQIANKDQGKHTDRLDRLANLPLDELNALLEQVGHDPSKDITHLAAIRACQILDEREQAA